MSLLQSRLDNFIGQVIIRNSNGAHCKDVPWLINFVYEL